MTRNRRKPRVVIPSNVDQLIATAMRVAGAIATSIIASMTNVSELRDRIIGVATEARNRSDAAVRASEMSQDYVRRRNDLFARITDRLIQVRDYAFATDGRTSPGMLGFEVTQSTSSSGRATVVIPSNPDQFLALANRVNQAVIESSDNNLLSMVAGMTQDIEIATSNQAMSIQLREQWQLELDERQTQAAILTALMREVRDLGFAAAGPYRYETVSTTGLIVLSSATQGDGNGQPVENWTNEVRRTDSEISEVRLLADVVVAFSNLADVSTIDQSLRNDERLVTLEEAMSIFSEEFGTTDFVEQAFNSVSEPPRVARLDDVVEAFLECQREAARVATASGTPTEETRTVEEVVQQVLAENPEASRDQFFESDWLASTVARTAPNTNEGGFLAGTVDPDGVRRTFIGGVNLGCAFTAYDVALETTDPSTLAPQPRLNVFDLAAQFRLCLISSGNDGLPDEQAIGTADEIAEGIAQSAGILDDLIDEQEFLGNLPFGEAAAPCGVFAWLTVRQGISNSQPEPAEISAPIETFTETLSGIVDREVTPESLGLDPGQSVTLQQLRDAVASAGADDLTAGLAFEAWNIHFELEAAGTDDVFAILGISNLDQYEGFSLTVEQFARIFSENEIQIEEGALADAFQQSL